MAVEEESCTCNIIIRVSLFAFDSIPEIPFDPTKIQLGQERPQYVYPAYYTSDGYQAKDLPVGQMGNVNFCELNKCATMPQHDIDKMERLVHKM